LFVHNLHLYYLGLLAMAMATLPATTLETTNGATGLRAALRTTLGTLILKTREKIKVRERAHLHATGPLLTIVLRTIALWALVLWTRALLPVV
jgi:hypothetical protein